ncbi:MAG: 5'-nucleotidase C-terminal domain-containing protein [Prevotella sp.]|uniref:bifunctional metallophosphatase/5'-nucleotidase n=1 Tax=Prevotella sp. TaxID=59823 RepID=UPI002A25BBAC|nr:5'-nucleotidase C-terminal domain-containing protein [Prevotella sp.]MDD7318518.1 5'-nucleotidase C-terminal domain-containing protein [Prevotellaceae bacterium]MDY4020323.1 5'-nucleotidase C-terminal domain-containing protein [Prevotella sp.]
MKKGICVLLAALGINIFIMAQTKNIELRIVETSDVHGCFFPYDFINRKPMSGTLARVSTYVNRLRKEYGNNLLLLDNGDILQGQPTCYYCNYVNPEMENVAASVINYLRYDAETIGNHDVETGHAVYDKWISEVKCPMLGANIIDTMTGQPYLKPYTIIEREGVRIAVLGMLTPAIPSWLNEELWQGLRFDDIVKMASYWVKHLKEEERADIVVGMFHSGRDGGIKTAEYEENQSMRVAREIPGFDIILYGHDHTSHKDVVKGADGNDVLCLDPSCNAFLVGDAKISITMTDGKITEKRIEGDVVDVSMEDIDEDFVNHFKPQIDSVRNYVDRVIGTCDATMLTSDCYFGSAEFTDFIHNIQLRITGADISFNAPLTFDSKIAKGEVRVSDMFNLYRYENQIYVLRMTGEEVRKHLEMSYDQWVTTMQSPDDHIMLLDEYTKNDKQRFGFKNLAFNFDSAAGIIYEVDVTKPDGEKVRILSMADGSEFREDKWYNVVMNSYRGNGGGELLTRGAGIPHSELEKRRIYASEKDQRYYLMKEIERMGTIYPKANNNWHFVPEEWTAPAIARDKELIFGK